MKKEDAEEFTQSLGQIFAGSWRQIKLADELGVPKTLGLSLGDWVKTRLGGYVKLAVEDRRNAAVELAAEGKSEREISDVLGVSDTTVHRDLASNEAPSENNQEGGADISASFEAHAPVLRRTPPPPEGQFSVILADPPWRYDFAETNSRQIENQYPTMDIDDICELGSTMPFADNAVLFLWGTAPKLVEALHVISAWRFEYVTHAIWDKEIIGMGYWFRGQHELLLVAKRGEFPPPAESGRVPSVIHGRRAKHSEKPEAAYRMIEAAYPELTENERLEIFARNRRDGWTPWGNEVLSEAA